MKNITAAQLFKLSLRIGRQLLIKLGLSLLMMAPGLLLCLAGFPLVGTLLMLTGSFLMLARRYQQPWRWNLLMAYLPAFVALLGFLMQSLVFQKQSVGGGGMLLGLAAGAAFGWQRGRTHQVSIRDGKMMVERTSMFLVIWIACTAVTQLSGMFALPALVTTGMFGAVFSIAMLAAVAIVIHSKVRTMGGEKELSGMSSTATRGPATGNVTTAVCFLVVSIGFSSFVNAAPRQDLNSQLRVVGEKSVGRATGLSDGLIENSIRFQSPSQGSGQTMTMHAFFDVKLETYTTDTDTRVEMTRFDEQRVAQKAMQAQQQGLKRLAENSRGVATRYRSEKSIHAEYTPQSGGVAHRALIQHGLWLIDVDSVAWEPSKPADQLLLKRKQQLLVTELAASLFQEGVDSGLILQEPVSEPSAGSTVPTNLPARLPQNRIASSVPPSVAPADISIFENDAETPDYTPQDIANLTALIALILLAGNFSLDAATAIATAIAEGMVDTIETNMDSEELDELGEEIDKAEAQLDVDDEKENGEADPDAKSGEVRGTVPFYDREVVEDGLRGSWADVKTAGSELADIVPVAVDGAVETMRDLSAVHPANFDLERIEGMRDDLLAAGKGLYNALRGLAQLAGDQVATNIDQDPNVLSAMELLAIISRESIAPGSMGADRSHEALHELLTSRRDEVQAGLLRIAEVLGKGGYEAGRMALGVQEWENALNGDLSPLTRIANALAGSAQTAGLLHSAGSSIANQLAGSTDEFVDGVRVLDAGHDAAIMADGTADATNAARRGAPQLSEGPNVPGYADELPNGARPRQQWPWETRRNPSTGEIEFRQSPDSPFEPLPADVADEMRNRSIGKGEYRMNPDTGEVEWRNPSTGEIEPKAPLNNDVRPGYEQTSRTTATGRDAGLRNLPEGSVVPDELMPQTGYAPNQIDELARLAKEEDVIFAGRTTNMDSLEHIANKTGTPKPVDIKSKTIQELDTYLGADPADKGLVGYFEPKPVDPSKIDPNVNPELYREVKARYDRIPANLRDDVLARHQLRADEFNELRADIDRLIENKKVVEKNGKLHRVFSDGSTKPFAGDIDPVYIRDAKTGKVLSGDRYLEVLEKFKKSGAEIQHGSEFNMSADLLRNYQPGTPEYEAAVQKISKLHQKLEKGHTSGGEIAVEMWPDGKLRRANQQRWLGMEV